MNAALGASEVREAYARQGMATLGGTVDDAAAYIARKRRSGKRSSRTPASEWNDFYLLARFSAVSRVIMRRNSVIPTEVEGFALEHPQTRQARLRPTPDIGCRSAVHYRR